MVSTRRSSVAISVLLFSSLVCNRYSGSKMTTSIPRSSTSRRTSGRPENSWNDRWVHTAQRPRLSGANPALSLRDRWRTRNRPTSNCTYRLLRATGTSQRRKGRGSAKQNWSHCTSRLFPAFLFPVISSRLSTSRTPPARISSGRTSGLFHSSSPQNTSGSSFTSSLHRRFGVARTGACGTPQELPRVRPPHHPSTPRMLTPSAAYRPWPLGLAFFLHILLLPGGGGPGCPGPHLALPRPS